MGLGFEGGGSKPVVYTLVNPNLGLSTSARLLVNNITITDTNLHTVFTDPNYIYTYYIGNTKPRINSWKIFLYNSTNQALTAYATDSITNTTQYPLANLNSASGNISVAANNVGEIISSPYIIPEYLSVAMQFSTAPTSGTVIGYLFLYY